MISTAGQNENKNMALQYNKVVKGPGDMNSTGTLPHPANTALFIINNEPGRDVKQLRQSNPYSPKLM